MVNSLLFRWEDSQALQHHCGFCERPLSHPGARASCFGTHSEPCHRFHQAMFMRNRAHMCNYCSAIDEAHYKRHHELVTQLRGIYESCGEVDWTVVPAESGDQRRGRPSEPTNNTATGSLAPDETPTTRRERKDVKCLIRAASRARVVTQEEIRYVDSVLHSAEDIVDGEVDGPANLEEVQLIEDHLRYNANVYNSHSSRRDLRTFAKIPDVDVDFEGEMERVLDTFHITELVKRNFRNRGLQGKELRIFDALIETFRDAVVEDLVLVKKDMMEIRMRRAGYLRYTSKTAYGIVEDRYTGKDWKTGERIMSSSSASSGLSSQSEEVITPHESIPELPTYSSPKGPDQRHLQHVHTRITGEDGLGQAVIEPYHTPLLPLPPNIPLKKPAVLQLKVVENKENGISAGMTNRGWLRREVARQKPAWPLQTTETDSLSIRSVNPSQAGAVREPAWGKIRAKPKGSVAEFSNVDDEELLTLDVNSNAAESLSSRSKARAVQSSVDDKTFGFKGPERAITPEHVVQEAHPAVSQKKAKKAQREAKRKAKKVSDPEQTLNPITVDAVSFEVDEQGFEHTLLGNPAADNASNAMGDVFIHSLSSSSRELIYGAQVDATISVAVEHDTGAIVSNLPSPPPTLYTTHGKHEHWMRFSRVFVVDQLTVPLLQSFEGCPHGSSCLFESHGEPDCPFHEPHCSCGDPLLNQCYLMHPSKELCTSGPYNQVCGARLLAIYEEHDRTRGRVMLVDDDMVSYFTDLDNSSPMPPRLLREHTEFLDGYDRGPLMKQELEFERLFLKNISLKHPLTTRTLQDIQRLHFGPKGSIQMCYCQVEVPCTISGIRKEFSKGHVSCSYRECEFGGVFHKRCVKKLGVEKVSRWYCTACEKQMKALACRTLGVVHNDETAAVSVSEKRFAEKVVAKMLAKPDAMKHFKSRLQELHAGDMRSDLEIEDVD